MVMVAISDTMSDLFFANVCLAIIEDMCQHFSEPTVMDNFEGPRLGIVFPYSNLQDCARQLGMHQHLDLMTLLPEWKWTGTGGPAQRFKLKGPCDQRNEYHGAPPYGDGCNGRGDG